MLMILALTTPALLGLGQDAPTPQVTVAITEPREGANVGRDVTVRGTASVPGGQNVWLVIRRTDFDPFWWTVAVIHPKAGTGQFDIKGTVGEANDVGSDFDVAVITVTEQAHQELLEHFAENLRTRTFTPIRLPATTSPPRIIKVHKVSHR